MNSLLGIDHTVTFWFQHAPHWLHPYMWFLTQFGGAVPVCVLAVVLAGVAWAKSRRRLSAAFLAVLPAELMMAGLKLLFHRARPDTPYAHAMLVHTNSFPSGHAFGSIVLYGLLAYLAHKHLAPPWKRLVPGLLGILVVLVGVSRVYLGAHWALDVLGGWLFGGVALWAIIKFTKV